MRSPISEGERRFAGQLIQDLAYAARSFRRRPALLSAAILTLALGIGAATALMTMVDHLYVRPLPYPAPDDLHVVWGVRGEADQVQPSYLDFQDWRRTARSADLAFALGDVYAVTTGPGVEQVTGAAVSTGFFGVMGTPPLLGRTFAPEEEEAGDAVVVLSHRLWMRMFGGDAEVLGRTVVVNGAGRHVIGVMPPGFEWPEWAELWEPLATGAAGVAQLGRREVRVDTRALARVRSGYSVTQVESELRTVAAGLAEGYPESNEGLSLRLASLQEEVIGDVGASVALMTMAALLILLLTCANVAAVILGRSVDRTRELAVRVALGAGRGRLVRQLVTENTALAVAGGVLGTGLAFIAVRLMARSAVSAGVAAGVPLPRLTELTVDGRTFAVAVAVTLTTAVLFAVLPAVAAVRGVPAGRLRQRGGPGGRATVRAQAILAALQLAVAVATIAGAGLLMRTLAEIRATDPGFQPEGLLVLRIFPPEAYTSDEARVGLYETIAERVAAVPGVAGVALINHMSYAGGQVPTALAPEEGWPPEGPPGGAPGDETMLALFRTVSPAYFDVARQPIVRGRPIAPGESRSDVVVLSEGLAQTIWPGEEALGRRLELTNPNPGSAEQGQPFGVEVVGIAADVRNSPRGEPLPTVYVPHARVAWGNMYVVARSAGRAETLVQPLRAAAAEVEPALPTASLQPLTHHVLRATQRERAFARLMGVCGAVALLLAGIGTYGALSNLVVRRLPELGVRAALGARPVDLRRLVLGRAGWIVATGTAAGALVAIALGRVIEDMLFGVTPADLASILGAAGLLTAIGLLASAVPALRAGRTDPVRLLGSE